MKRLEPLTPEPKPSEVVIIVIIALMIVFFVMTILYGLNGVYEHVYNIGGF